MPKNKAGLTINQKYMEKFFKKRLKNFFPHAQKFESLEIKRHFTLAKEDFIARYKLVFIDKNNRIQNKFLRGVARDDNSKYYNFKITKLLWGHNFSKGECIVPRPLSYNFYLKQFLYEELPGQTMHRLMVQKENLNINFKKTARWLSKLHRLKLEKGIKINSLKEEEERIREIKKLLSLLVSHYQPFKSDFSKLLDRFWNLEKKILKPGDFILIHNDFSPGNIIIDKNKIGCIDFVGSCCFHPFTDVGTFLAYLDSPLSPLISKDGFSPEDIKSLKETLLKEYCRKSGLRLEEIRDQVILFEARAILIMVMHLTKLALDWGRGHNYKWVKEPAPRSIGRRIIKIYESFQNPKFIELVLKKAENYVQRLH